MRPSHLFLGPRCAAPTDSLAISVYPDLADEFRQTVREKPSLVRRPLWIPHAQGIIAPSMSQARRPIDVDTRVVLSRLEIEAGGASFIGPRNVDEESIPQHPIDELPLEVQIVPRGISLKKDLSGDIAGQIPGPL
jgi:hypothetical protein